MGQPHRDFTSLTNPSRDIPSGKVHASEMPPPPFFKENKPPCPVNRVSFLSPQSRQQICFNTKESFTFSAEARNMVLAKAQPNPPRLDMAFNQQTLVRVRTREFQ